jgi:hypothetical protein
MQLSAWELNRQQFFKERVHLNPLNYYYIINFLFNLLIVLVYVLKIQKIVNVFLMTKIFFDQRVTVTLRLFLPYIGGARIQRG